MVSLSFFRRLSIRSQLLLLVLIVLATCAAFAAWHVANDARHARRAAYEKVKIVAGDVAHHLELALSDHEEVLRIAAAEFRGNPPVRAQRFNSEQFVRNRPHVINLGVRDLRANNIYSHRPNPTPPKAALEFPWVEQGLRSETFVAGDAFQGTLSGRWVTVLTYPVRGDDGRRSGFVNLSLDLLALNERVMYGVPKDALVPVFDRADRFLLRSADPATWIGKPLPAVKVEAIRGMREGFITETDLDGVRRVYALVTIPGTGWRVFAGLPEDGVFADYRAALRRSIAVGIFALLLVLVLARQTSLAIARPIRELAAIAEKISGGEHGARAHISGATEIEHVARQFNHMLDALERQRDERAALTRHIEQLFKLARDIILLIGPSGEIIEANDAAVAAYGYSAEELRRMNISDLRTEAAQAAVERDWQHEHGPEGVLFETEHRRKNGSTFPVEISAQTLDIDGRRYRQNFVRDISERHAADAQIRRQNRAYATLSETNQLIVRLRDKSRLYPRICSIAAEFGGYACAWVGLIDAASKQVLPEAAAGSAAGYVDKIRVSTDPDLPEGQGPLALALRQGRPYYCQDFLHDAVSEPWRATAAEFGLRSMAALPLRSGGAVVGALALYAGERGAFDPATQALIEEMAEDVSFALDNFQREAARERTEAELVQSEARFRSMLEQNVSAMFVLDDGKLSYVNRRAAEILGYAEDELIGMSMVDLVAESDRAGIAEAMRQLLSGEQRTVEHTFGALRKDGSIADMGGHAILATVQGRKVILGMAQDIGERKRAQAEIDRYVERLENAMESTLQAVSSVVELRDPYTAGHERRVGELAAAIGAEMGLPESTVKGLRLAGYVHDLGKISVPAEILSKPTRLAPMEYELIKNHPQSGFEVLKNVDFPWPVAQIILQHHERLDGSGYPRKLKGDEIILEARVMAVADVVEAMSSHRPYRPGIGLDAALAEIETNSGRFYDARVVAACLRLFRERGYALPG
ncbi:MAG: PAS domain S-box protein [Burkholderiales bacterium]|nr:PAS domain S-box protein [Burkholderiales bacterium]